MRLWSFHILRNFKRQIVFYSFPKRLSNTKINAETEAIGEKHLDGSLLEFHQSWLPDLEADLRSQMLTDMRVLPDFVSKSEEAQLMAELEPYLKKMRYEFDHWDDAIHGYRETERTKWSPENAEVFERVKKAALLTSETALPHQHVLDLAPSGYIKPHIDAVRFCGDVIAGLSLLSDAVMQLQHPKQRELVVNALLPRRSLYIMSGSARRLFEHAVLQSGAPWRGREVRKTRRVALITRSRPLPLD